MPAFGDLKRRAKDGIEVPDGVPESTEILDGDSHLCLLGLLCAIFHDELPNSEVERIDETREWVRR
ncbi:hypothetical protein DMH25_27250 [Streptomyces sp. WAC 01325]|nr:hypothetical protein DMH25_27250 [Streptomyces sp. WAC 01325]